MKVADAFLRAVYPLSTRRPRSPHPSVTFSPLHYTYPLFSAARAKAEKSHARSLSLAAALKEDLSRFFFSDRRTSRAYVYGTHAQQVRRGTTELIKLISEQGGAHTPTGTLFSAGQIGHPESVSVLLPVRIPKAQLIFWEGKGTPLLPTALVEAGVQPRWRRRDSPTNGIKEERTSRGGGRQDHKDEGDDYDGIPPLVSLFLLSRGRRPT